MKELKKFLNKSTELVYKFLGKVANFIKDDKESLRIKTFIKLAILILIYFVCGLIADGLVQGGTYIIYKVAETGRALLSGIWNIAVNLTYFLFVIVSLYQLTNMAEKDNKFFNLYKNKKKDKDAKKKIFFTLETIIKILGILILIPLFIGDIASLFIFGILVGYLRKGIYLISAFIFVIGLVIFFTSAIILIKKLISSTKIDYKKYIVGIIISGFLIASSSVGVLFETSSYKINKELTTDFNMSVLRYEYKMDTKKDYVIYNNGYDKNLELVIDDDLGSYIEVVITHSTTNEVKTSIKTEDKKVRISYDQDLNITTSDFKNIINLGVSCIKDKTIYNYTLLKYAKIQVRVSEQYKDNIKFVNSKGKEYTPNERSN